MAVVEAPERARSPRSSVALRALRPNKKWLTLWIPSNRRARRPVLLKERPPKLLPPAVAEPWRRPMLLLEHHLVNDRWALRRLWKTSNNPLGALPPISSRATQRTIIRKVDKGKGLFVLRTTNPGWGFG
jgi:hypothetical protein